ncbi:hypothetical protein IHQ68_13190 [Chelatococcus sambhunathii]|uniref:Uncharacterized protein n=1 Tax=Chelatococcus sambhunathii TaxID=363953 RepID=A0ABU1DHR4_9HYPH|nr:hypothetical protein [Chelatococcus sambhunathii]MDR4307573.1 hypothetical protein [Chelatococcus sambhunathii]
MFQRSSIAGPRRLQPLNRRLAGRPQRFLNGARLADVFNSNVSPIHLLATDAAEMEDPLTDFLMLAGGIAGFATLAAYALACERL